LGRPKDHVPKTTRQCLFFGLGADGTVGANKEVIKLIVSNTKLCGQADFADDAHKSGGLTMSHIRFGEDPIDAPYCVQQADYVVCRNPAYLQKLDIVGQLQKGGVYVVNIAEGTDFDKAFPVAM
jgi:pyruvate-ferredoxin/flavodoxin oxidoreductase